MACLYNAVINEEERDMRMKCKLKLILIIYTSHFPSYDGYGYIFIHKHRENRTGVGVGLYLSNELQFKSRNDLHFSDSNSIDALFIEVINSQGKNSIVGVAYRPPDQNLNTFVHDFNSLAEKISRENKRCFIMVILI
jgi:hypothetical protein